MGSKGLNHHDVQKSFVRMVELPFNQLPSRDRTLLELGEVPLFLKAYERFIGKAIHVFRRLECTLRISI